MRKIFILLIALCCGVSINAQHTCDMTCHSGITMEKAFELDYGSESDKKIEEFRTYITKYKKKPSDLQRSLTATPGKERLGFMVYPEVLEQLNMSEQEFRNLCEDMPNFIQEPYKIGGIEHPGIVYGDCFFLENEAGDDNGFDVSFQIFNNGASDSNFKDNHKWRDSMHISRIAVITDTTFLVRYYDGSYGPIPGGWALGMDPEFASIQYLGNVSFYPFNTTIAMLNAEESGESLFNHEPPHFWECAHGPNDPSSANTNPNGFAYSGSNGSTIMSIGNGSINAYSNPNVIIDGLPIGSENQNVNGVVNDRYTGNDGYPSQHDLYFESKVRFDDDVFIVEGYTATIETIEVEGNIFSINTMSGPTNQTVVGNIINDELLLEVNESGTYLIEVMASTDSTGYENPTYITVEFNEVFVDNDGDGYNSEEDCNDANEYVHPGMTESCNGIDDDCNLAIDDGLEVSTFYRDVDGDGFGNDAESIESCYNEVEGYVLQPGDCDDNDVDLNDPTIDSDGDTNPDCLDPQPLVGVIDFGESQIRILENPVKDILSIENNDNLVLSYRLFCSIGQQIKFGPLLNNSLDVGTMPTGIYIINIIDKSGSSGSIQFIKS